MKITRLLALLILLYTVPGFAQDTKPPAQDTKPAAQEIKPPAPVAPTIPALARSANGQKQDAGYTAKIREYTTEPFFLTELVDHLPASDKVPTPEKVLGYIAGAVGKLTYTADVNRYMRELEKTSKRVKVFSIGMSEEGREMIAVAVSDEANLRKLDRNKEILARLADPRKTNDKDAEKLIREGKAVYYFTGAMHSPETGSPEMLMELAYRLAVEETPFVKDIRKNVITLITPVLETDGRDRVLDVIKMRKQFSNMPLPWWGKYVAHDNNRDGMSLALALTRAVMRTFLEFHPTVLHDLHESVPFLYTSTGTGPYNAWLDPIVVNEWHMLAYHEINEMTRRGVPGVWTHGFYDGWAPNYMFYIANGHNSIGRFYETFGNSSPETQDRTVGGQSNRDWFRPNPPLPRVRWSLRNNVNMQQSGVLLALSYVSAHKDDLLHNFYLKSKRSVAKATTEGPAAYVLPANDSRPGQQAELIRLLRLQGVEVHRTDSAATVQGVAFPVGSYVVRMDQPYSRMADMLLDRQFYNVNDPSPYDDTGWTLGPLKNVRTYRVTDAAVLTTPMALLKEDPKPLGGEVKPLISSEITSGSSQGVGFTIVPNAADALLMTWRMRLKDIPMEAIEEKWEFEGHTFAPGSLIVRTQDLSASTADQVRKISQDLGVPLYSIVLPREFKKLPKTHPVSAPRIAILHPWTNTQNDGWFRLAFEQWQVPYDYASVHVIRDTSDLRSKYDVIILPPTFSGSQALMRGLTGNSPIPWKKTTETPHLGMPDRSDDIRGGIEENGRENLKRFVQEGGLLIAIQGASNIPIDFGLAAGVATTRAPGLQAQGSVLGAVVADPLSPVTYGYDNRLGVYYRGGPLFRKPGEADATDATAPETTAGTRGGGQGGRRGGGTFSGPGGRPSGRGSLDDPDIVQVRTAPKRETSLSQMTYDTTTPLDETEKGPAGSATGPRVLLRFAGEKNLLISGMLSGGAGLAGRPALIDVPVGKGHVLLFAINPMWRMQTQGSYPLLFNAALHFDHLDAGR